MQSRPKVSILMNCYNGERWLKEAIDSIYAQTYQNWEIIFIDNCSTDNSSKIIGQYDHRLKYYKTNRNISLGSARNWAMQFISGKYLAFLDVDDLWLPQKLQLQIEQLENNLDFMLCYTGNYFINDESNNIRKRVPKSRTGYVFPSLLKYYDVNWQTVMVRFDKKYCFFCEEYVFAEDYEFVMRITSKYNAIVLSTALVKYRLHDHNETKKTISRHWVEQKMTLDSILADNVFLRSKYPKEIRLAYAKVLYYKALSEYYIDNDRQGRLEMKKIRFISIEYFILYIFSLLPLDAWRRFHHFMGKVRYL